MAVESTVTEVRESETKARIAELKYAIYLMRQNPLVLAGSILVVFFVFIGLTATLLVSPDTASALIFTRSYCWPSSVFSWTSLAAVCPAGTFLPLGTDGYGRSVLDMIVLAIPLDLSIAFIIVAIATGFGLVVGSVAGWIGGKFDEAVLRITDILRISRPCLGFGLRCVVRKDYPNAYHRSAIGLVANLRKASARTSSG
jgi:ABC-type dipeptide/oligopeptide/nickel transport system permease subunit